jgi:patatin-like phospholipase/acyl hydrolase
MGYRERETAPGPKRLLALDGGGIRGVLTLEVLARIEATLRERLGAGPQFVLADWFDYIAGTSTGAIIAAALAKGMSVGAIADLYRAMAKPMFKRRALPLRAWSKYEARPITQQLRDTFGDMRFGDPSLRTLLMLVLRNASTDSPWTLSNATTAKYNATTRADCNLELPLWQLVRASTAAPSYFAAEEVMVGDRRFVFVDGGLTSYNNPALQLFVMATAGAYRLRWPVGERRLLLVSVGTGFNPKANANLRRSGMHLGYTAASVPSALMFAAMNQQDMLCRILGRCRCGEPIDNEVGTLQKPALPLHERLFTYVRYNARIDRAGLDALRLKDIDPKRVQRLDAIDAIDELARIGRAVAERDVRLEHFASFLPER